MDLGTINTALKDVAHIFNQIRNNVTNYYTTQSLPQITKLSRVEPLTIVSRDCSNLDIMPDVLNSLTNIFTSHYLRAISILTKVNDVEVVRLLDKLNPDRDSAGFLLAESLANESYRTLALENYKHSLPMRGVAVLEADRSSSIVTENANLSVGKEVEVDLGFKTENGEQKSVKLPINIRLAARIATNPTIRSLLAKNHNDTSMFERIHDVRSGRIEFVRDFVFCQDLIDEQKRMAISDDSGTVQEIMRRVANSKKFGVLTKNPSLATAANIYVITEEMAREVEAKLGGKMSNIKTREKMFENSYAMVVTVIDREYEEVHFYVRDVSAGMSLTFKELKAFSKGNKGPDIADMLKAFQMGAPAF